ncbi:hypothetical protein HY024_03550 [Candidatus Curtissbacteria bacterium]|nr:hypothetical protein [Candidatus Curtissbacteria bacterium]
MIQNLMRDHSWLQSKLEELLKTYFADVPITNPIEIKWGREAKFRFGSIKLEGGRRILKLRAFGGLFTRKIEMQESSDKKLPKKSIITITSMFKNEDVPVDVVCYTICHELTHYAHGFSSTNKRMFKHPHHGGVVNAEIQKRGGTNFVKAYQLWLKEYRRQILAGRRRI